MKISGGDHLVVTHTWSKNYFSNIKLTGLKVDCPKMPLSQNAPVSPTTGHGMMSKCLPLIPSINSSLEVISECSIGGP